MYSEVMGIAAALRGIKPAEFRREDDGDDKCYDANNEAVIQWLVQCLGTSLVMRRTRGPGGRWAGNVDFYADNDVYGLTISTTRDFERPDEFDPRGLFINDQKLSRLRRETDNREPPGIGWIVYYSIKTGDVLLTTLNRIVLPGAHEEGVLVGTYGVFVPIGVFKRLGNYDREPIETDFRYHQLGNG